MRCTACARAYHRWLVVVTAFLAVLDFPPAAADGRELLENVLFDPANHGHRFKSVGENSNSGSNSWEDAVARLVSASPRIYGKVTKEGAPDFDDVTGDVARARWIPKWEQWLFRHVLGEDDGTVSQLADGVEAPVAANCMLLFNPHYKFVFIKNTKIAGTTVFTHLGGFCPRDQLTMSATNKLCFWTWYEMVAVGLEALGYATWDQLWADYTAFTIARNPFDRAASSYHYCLQRRGNILKERENVCKPPSFRHFCHRPYVIGLQSLLFQCLVEDSSASTPQAPPNHDFAHVEPQARCLSNSKGQRVIDWVLRLDSLSEDLNRLCEAISNRHSSLPRLPQKAVEHRNMGEHFASSGSSHASDFIECGHDCVSAIARYYHQDFAYFGFPDSLDALNGLSTE